MAKTFTTMEHLNGDMLTVVDTETTGLEAGFNEIVQLAIVPLDSQILPRKDLMPLNLLIRPNYPERWDRKIFDKGICSKERKQKIMDTGIDQDKAKDVLEEWFMRLDIPVNKFGNRNKMVALGHNFAFDKSMLSNWLGVTTFDMLWHYHHRDSMVAALTLNDRAAWKANKVPFPKVNLTYLATTLGIKNDYPHDAYYDCLTTAEVYRRLMSFESGLV